MSAAEHKVWKVVLISPRRGEEKHPANPLAVSQRFLNFGALALATFLTRAGWPTLVVDEYCVPEGKTTREFLLGQCGPIAPTLVGVSCISAYSADRAREILKEMEGLWPEVPRVIGGQHFVGYWRTKFPHYMPEADVLVAGEADASVLTLLEQITSAGALNLVSPSDLPKNIFWKCGATIVSGTKPQLPAADLNSVVAADYNLYPGSVALFPSIEFSRGCPFSCVFCANNRDNRRSYRRASAEAIGQAVAQLLSQRPERPVQFYMQASNFEVTKEEAGELAQVISAQNGLPEWRTEVRVDGLRPEVLPILAEAGLRVLDVGLESASIATLKVMNKTLDPEGYLVNASILLQAAREAGIFTKVNFLIHPGDTSATLAESRVWLHKHSQFISAVSSGVTIEYPGTSLSEHLSRYARLFGTRRLPHPLSEWGVFNLQPSTELSFDKATAISLEIAQSLQTRSAFAASKAFGYLGSRMSTLALADLPEASHGTPYSADETT